MAGEELVEVAAFGFDVEIGEVETGGKIGEGEGVVELQGAALGAAEELEILELLLGGVGPIEVDLGDEVVAPDFHFALGEGLEDLAGSGLIDGEFIFLEGNDLVNLVEDVQGIFVDDVVVRDVLEEPFDEEEGGFVGDVGGGQADDADGEAVDFAAQAAVEGGDGDEFGGGDVFLLVVGQQAVFVGAAFEDGAVGVAGRGSGCAGGEGGDFLVANFPAGRQ